jgi:O-Antigen ligase
VPTTSAISSDENARRLVGRLEVVASVWLVALPILRPLVWSGQPTDVPNLLWLVLLAAAATTGLLLRGLQVTATDSVVRWWRRPAMWGVAFLLIAAFGSWTSSLPAAAWTLTCGWALHLAAPWALWPMIQRRPHLLVAGLVAGLTGEMMLMIGQACFERPHLAEQFSNDPTLSVEQRIADQYSVRISSWRLEGTFLLANTLASYLVMVVPLVTAMAWKSRHSAGAKRWLTIALALAAVVALIMTGSKAGLLAMLVASVITGVVVLGSWRWRMGIAAAVLLALAIILVIPATRASLAASAGVRLDYWRAGVELVSERPLNGHGLEGFAVNFPRVKPPAGEETVLAHQETLQTAVDLGLPAMFVVLGWWLMLLWSLWPQQASLPKNRSAEEVPATPIMSRAIMIGVVAVLSVAVFVGGILMGNMASYPGAMPMTWSALLITLLALVAKFAVRLPLPPALACWCAVLACLVHVQADFSLHSMQVVGIMAWVVCLGQVMVRSPMFTSSMNTTVIGSARRQAIFAGAGMLLLAAVTAGIIASSWRGEILDRARQTESIMSRMRLAQSGRLNDAQREQAQEAFDHAVGRIVAEDGRAALAAEPMESLAVTIITRALTESRRFPADHDLVYVAVAISEHFQALEPKRSVVMTPILEGLISEWPSDLLVTKVLSEHYLRRARVADEANKHIFARQAQALAQRAVALYPTHLPLRKTHIAAAELNGDAETVKAERQEIERLKPLVHVDNRSH